MFVSFLQKTHKTKANDKKLNVLFSRGDLVLFSVSFLIKKYLSNTTLLDLSVADVSFFLTSAHELEIIRKTL